MNKKKNMSKKSWKKSKRLKATFISSVLMLLLIGSVVQAIDVSTYEIDKSNVSYNVPKASYNKPKVVELGTNNKWVHSERKLFFEKVGWQVHFIGIQAMMLIPDKIETGQTYVIPLYFTRFTVFNQNRINTNLLIKKSVLDPLEVFICGGISTNSNQISLNSLNYCFQIDIGVQNGGTWTYDIPIFLTVAESTNSVNQKAVVGFDQKIWIKKPDFGFLRDVPVGVWDGPYKIIVRIDPITFLPAVDMSQQENGIPPPIPPTAEEINSETLKLISMLFTK